MYHSPNKIIKSKKKARIQTRVNWFDQASLPDRIYPAIYMIEFSRQNIENNFVLVLYAIVYPAD
jgi:hypothetical protein